MIGPLEMKSHWHDHDFPRPADKTWNDGAGSVLMISAVDALEVEKPSQLMIFLLAANLGGIGMGFLGLTSLSLDSSLSLDCW